MLPDSADKRAEVMLMATMYAAVQLVAMTCMRRTQCIARKSPSIFDGQIESAFDTPKAIVITGYQPRALFYSCTRTQTCPLATALNSRTSKHASHAKVASQKVVATRRLHAAAHQRTPPS